MTSRRRRRADSARTAAQDRLAELRIRQLRIAEALAAREAAQPDDETAAMEGEES
jgi:hypothetical protein